MLYLIPMDTIISYNLVKASEGTRKALELCDTGIMDGRGWFSMEVILSNLPNKWYDLFIVSNLPLPKIIPYENK